MRVTPPLPATSACPQVDDLLLIMTPTQDKEESPEIDLINDQADL